MFMLVKNCNENHYSHFSFPCLCNFILFFAETKLWSIYAKAARSWNIWPCYIVKELPSKPESYLSILCCKKGDFFLKYVRIGYTHVHVYIHAWTCTMYLQLTDVYCSSLQWVLQSSLHFIMVIPILVQVIFFLIHIHVSVTCFVWIKNSLQ